MMNKLPWSLKEANISFCFFVDLKLLSKILALRLEKILPFLIDEDQTGFIKGRSSSNHIRRLLNVLKLSHNCNIDTLILSLGSEKAFDCVAWPYLFFSLERFGLGSNFIRWVRLLYSAPTAAVVTNNFPLFRGTRQGCPLFPLLFALVIEPLAQAISGEMTVSGMSVVAKEHKISPYTNDILLFLSNFESSVPSLVDTVN